MGFFGSLKGGKQVGTDDLGTYQSSNTSNQYASGTHDELSTNGEKRRLFGNSSSRQTSSKPQSQSPASQSQSQNFSPPSGPPPSHSKAGEFSAPPGPPPAAQPAPYHDWTVVPDNALLPPPPALPQELSPTNNASPESAEAAHQWCAVNLPYTPIAPPPQVQSTSQSGELSIPRPQTLARTSELKALAPGTWSVKTRKIQQDCALISNVPLYFAAVDSPLHTEREKTIYYEVRVLSIRDDESAVAIGYAAQPYPPWRLPGWHRASLGVHGDDGRRFVNDTWGGRDFVGAFGVGDVVGIGMRYLVEEGSGGRDKCKTKIFFTRNGREEGGGWDIDEERDAERDGPEGVEGLQGELDMYPAVGVFGAVEAEIRFKKEDWLYKMA